MEGVVQLARGFVALSAFLLLFFAIANASAGRYLAAGAALVVGLGATLYVLRSRREIVK